MGEQVDYPFRARLLRSWNHPSSSFHFRPFHIDGQPGAVPTKLSVGVGSGLGGSCICLRRDPNPDPAGRLFC